MRIFCFDFFAQAHLICLALTILSAEVARGALRETSNAGEPNLALSGKGRIAKRISRRTLPVRARQLTSQAKRKGITPRQLGGLGAYRSTLSS